MKDRGCLKAGDGGNIDAQQEPFFYYPVDEPIIPSVSSQKKDLIANPDTSVDVYFGPEPPVGKESNWIQTIPGKGWWIYLRLNSPLEPWFDQSWRPVEIELVK